jgi:5'-3' exonuclease
MAEWRKLGTYQGNYAIYGLDADLIVLSLLGSVFVEDRQIWLFREEVNAGSMRYDENGDEIFEWFSINYLREWLCGGPVLQKQIIMNYCFAMSILGNDFLPSSLGLKIRDKGHTELLHLLQSCEWKLVDENTLAISFTELKRLFETLSRGEAGSIYKYVVRKRPIDENGIHLEAEERVLLGNNNNKLADNWPEIYLERFFNSQRIRRICDEYLYGIQWVWAYYTGQTESICYNWFYPFSLPPLWEWLKEANVPAFPAIIRVKVTDVKPTQQLSIVLPLESWGLIPACAEKMFCYAAPQFFPSVYTFESVGKQFFWECETNIPIPTILDCKMILATHHYKHKHLDK